MLVFDRPRQHHDVARASRHQLEASAGGVELCDWTQQAPQPADLDAQPRTMRFIGALGPEGLRDQGVS